MCLAKAYIGKKEEKGLLMEEIASIKVEDGKLLVTSLFGEKKEIAARIREIDFKSSDVILEKTGTM
jgi:predicted RNA-binding protein